MGSVFHPEVMSELFAIHMQAIKIDAYLEIKCMIQSEGLEVRRHINITPYSIITLLMPLKYHVFENIMENGAFALLEQMLLFP